jgi:RNA polymerase sigma-70 factor (ECF subfamily)
MIVIILPDIPAEDRLLALARAGDQDAVMRIYESYYPPIYNFIRLRVEDRLAAEDLASDVFVRLVRSLRGANAPRTSLRGWLFKVARNILRDYLGRHQQFTEEALEEWLPANDELDPELKFMRALDAERARKALRMLSADQQEVLLLRFGQMLSLQETADIMGRGVAAVKSLQFRAVNTLRQVLGEMRVNTYG